MSHTNKKLLGLRAERTPSRGDPCAPEMARIAEIAETSKIGEKAYLRELHETADRVGDLLRAGAPGWSAEELAAETCARSAEDGQRILFAALTKIAAGERPSNGEQLMICFVVRLLVTISQAMETGDLKTALGASLEMSRGVGFSPLVIDGLTVTVANGPEILAKLEALKAASEDSTPEYLN